MSNWEMEHRSNCAQTLFALLVGYLEERVPAFDIDELRAMADAALGGANARLQHNAATDRMRELEADIIATMLPAGRGSCCVPDIAGRG